MNRWLYQTLGIVTFAPLIIFMFSVLFLPDNIPSLVKDGSGEQHYGNKFTILFIPIISLILGFIYCKISKWAPKEVKEPSYERILLVVFIAAQLIWLAMTISCIIDGFKFGY